MQVGNSPEGTQKKSKRGGARPNAGRPPVREPQPPKGEAFILPQIKQAKGIDKFVNFLEWWHSLNEQQLAVMSAYVYRTWPLVDATGGIDGQDKNLEIMTGPCPFSLDNWQTDIMGRWGSGSYMFMVKEGNVHRWTVYANNLRDLQNYPPLIDYRTLMINDPFNKDFVKWARTRGLIKDYEGEDNSEMSNAALDRLASTADRLTDKVIALATDAASKQEPPNLDQHAQMRGIELVQEAGTKALDAVIGIMDRQAASRDTQTNPLEMVEKIVALTTAMNKGDDKVATFMSMMIEQQKEESRLLRAELNELRNRERETQARPREDRNDLFEQVKRLGEIKSTLVDLGIVKGDAGGNNEADTEEGSHKGRGHHSNGVWNQLIDAAARNLPALIGQGGLNGLLNTVINGAIVLRQGGTPTAPGTAPVTGAQLTGPSPLAQPTAPDPQTQFLMTITDPMLHHMSNDHLNGYTFARWMIDANSKGRQQYDLLQAAGTEQLTAVMQTYPPLWDVVGKMPAKLEKFMNEFMTLDAWELQQQQEDEEENEDEPITAGAGR